MANFIIRQQHPTRVIVVVLLFVAIIFYCDVLNEHDNTMPSCGSDDFSSSSGYYYHREDILTCNPVPLGYNRSVEKN